VPLWITLFSDAEKLITDQPNVRVTATKYYCVETFTGAISANNMLNPIHRDFGGWYPPERIASDFIGPAHWLLLQTLRQLFSDGDPTFVVDLRRTGDGITSPCVWTYPGAGGEKIAEMTFAKVGDYIWKLRFWSKYGYVRIAPDGTVTAEEITGEFYYTFGGIDVGGDADVSNPCNWDEFDELPSPILLDTSAGEYADSPDQGHRRERFSYLGVARAGIGSPVWPQRFDNANPSGMMLAVAQAKVFNASSWDLWTQNWQVELTSVRDWDDWARQIDEGQADAGATAGMVRQDDLYATWEYFTGLSAELADKYLTH
jgi:hypothetical protein